MNRVFLWSMRHGAPILFGIAILQLLLSLISPVAALLDTTSQMAGDHYYSPEIRGLPADIQIQLQVVLSALANSGIPFAAAVLVDRVDRWLSGRRPETPA